jgi:hypothetical protein
MLRGQNQDFPNKHSPNMLLPTFSHDIIKFVLAKQAITRQPTKIGLFCFLTAFGQIGKMLLFLHIFEINLYSETVQQENNRWLTKKR